MPFLVVMLFKIAEILCEVLWAFYRIFGGEWTNTAPASKRPPSWCGTRGDGVLI